MGFTTPGGGEQVIGSTELALKSVRIMDFWGKSWILKTQWIVDQLWILARISDCAFLDVRILGPKPEIWITDLSSAMVGMLMSSSKLFLFSHEAHLNSGPVHTYLDIFENGDFFFRI